MRVSLPPNILMSVSQGAIQIGTSEQRSNLSLSGTFTVEKVYHIGDFRNPDGNSWATILKTIPDFMEGGQTEAAEHATEVDQQQNQSSAPTTDTTATPQSQAAPQAFGSVFKRSVPRYR
jgi:hypothetical protein